MRTCGIYLDERCLRHVTGDGHPERAARLELLGEALAVGVLPPGATRMPSTPAGREVLERVHSPAYLDRLRDACARGDAEIDTPDCPICPASWDAATAAAGAAITAARDIAAGRVRRAFCAVRPPGHHAERDVAMGFCLLKNVALAAHVLRYEARIARVAIVDFDVHHGNGTQHVFEDDPTVLFISLHGDPYHLYPHTGLPTERGRDAGRGYTLNIPLPPGTEDAAYRVAFELNVTPALRRYQPQVLLASAGFDAHADDPLGILRLKDETFEWLAKTLRELADEMCEGRLLSVLEGGYDLGVLRRCVVAHVRELSA